ncbi:MAG TPA: hypothetical protein VLG12_00740 [Candidatus Saccharimonadales bacterium]|nr:hypothetical protein [Candidatus Saccharimonadales bacterium]
MSLENNIKQGYPFPPEDYVQEGYCTPLAGYLDFKVPIFVPIIEELPTAIYPAVDSISLPVTGELFDISKQPTMPVAAISRDNLYIEPPVLNPSVEPAITDKLPGVRNTEQAVLPVDKDEQKYLCVLEALREEEGGSLHQYFIEAKRKYDGKPLEYIPSEQQNKTLRVWVQEKWGSVKAAFLQLIDPLGKDFQELAEEREHFLQLHGLEEDINSQNAVLT